jgi:hypothetical protein
MNNYNAPFINSVFAWSIKKNRNLINFFASCPLGAFVNALIKKTGCASIKAHPALLRRVVICKL